MRYDDFGNVIRRNAIIQAVRSSSMPSSGKMIVRHAALGLLGAAIAGVAGAVAGSAFADRYGYRGDAVSTGLSLGAGLGFAGGGMLSMALADNEVRKAVNDRLKAIGEPQLSDSERV